MATPARDVRRTELAHQIWRIGAAHVSTGNRVALLRNGPATFDAMLDRISAAREDVSLESYIVRSDAVGNRFAPELISAARRGVRTRVIFDWIGSRSTKRAFVKMLRDGGVEVGIFNRPSLRRRWFGFLPRDHRKLLVVDGAGGVIGGIGLGHEWTTGTHPGDKDGSAWRDTAVNIDGPAGRDMQNAFERSWDRVVNRAKTDSDDSRPTERPSDDSLDNGGAMVAIMEGEPGRQRVTRALEVVTVAARSSIWISDAYFMPNMALVEALVGAARDGVDVRLLVPSRGDHPWMIRGTRKYYPRLLKNGVRIWEWKGEMMHAKTGVSDGQFVRIGSTDYNALGMAINFELDAMIHDEELGGAMTAMFEDDIARSKRIELDVAKD
ncbi:MAG TPA: phospholipase D-like domain-containing protein [Gemmatimonadaceae bacterium]|jgi:cardiolipin synthase|nr:phospholipase D-like domain-containing protein [Gemmatimonadaceae bacterium]